MTSYCSGEGLIGIFEYNRRLCSQGGLTGNDHGFEHSICACPGHATNERH